MPFFEVGDSDVDGIGKREEDFKLKKWVDQTFKVHDADKSDSLDKEELKTVLHEKEKNDHAENNKIKKWFYETFGLRDDENEGVYMGVDDEIFE